MVGLTPPESVSSQHLLRGKVALLPRRLAQFCSEKGQHHYDRDGRDQCDDRKCFGVGQTYPRRIAALPIQRRSRQARGAVAFKNGQP